MNPFILSAGENISIRDGFNAIHINSDMFDRKTGPFLMVDHFNMSAPTFPPHPHAGIAAVTYVLPESKGSHFSYDSIIGKEVIKPGDLHWFGAARGAIHTEQPEGELVEALQIFVNLPIANKLDAPYVRHLSADLMPVLNIGDIQAKVVVGSLDKNISPFESPIPMQIIDWAGAAGSSLQFTINQNWGGIIYCISGEIEILSSGKVYILDAGSAMGFESKGIEIQFSVRKESRWVSLFGELTGEPYVLAGPIIMESDFANKERIRAYQSGSFGDIKDYRD